MDVRENLRAGFSYSDRVSPILEGSVGDTSLKIDFHFDSAKSIFKHALANENLDLAEMSLATHCILQARGDKRFIGLPIFTSRMFRHHSIYVWKDRIQEPQELAGKRIGLPDYAMTSAVWLRGILTEHHGVDFSNVAWCIGDIDGSEHPVFEPSPIQHAAYRIPAREGASLVQMLEMGELDAIISPGLPQAYLSGDSGLRPLFRDPKQAEHAYFRNTGIFPIMHLCVLRRTRYERSPSIAQRLYHLFEHARQLAQTRLDQTDTLITMAPWADYAFDRAFHQLPGRGWANGLKENRHGLNTFFQYLKDQHLVSTPITLQDVFAADFIGGSQ